MAQEEFLQFEDTSGNTRKKRLLFPAWTKFILVFFFIVGLVWAISVTMLGGKKGRSIDASAMKPVTSAELAAIGTEGTDEYNRKVDIYAKAKAEEAAGSGRTYIAPVTPSGRPMMEMDKKTDIAPAQENARQPDMAPLRARETKVARQASQTGDQRMLSYLTQISSRLDTAYKPATLVHNKPAPHIVRVADDSGKTTDVDLTIPPGVKVGDILYSINRVTLDSDAPGPAMVEIIDGPYAGGKAIGQFTRANEHLTLEFSSLTMPDGTRYAIKGYAIDPHTDRTAVRSDVDTHAFERWFKFAAAKFLEGLGEAVASSGTASSYSVYGGGYSIPNYSVKDELWIAGGKVGQGAARIFERDFDKPPSVILKSGTEIGVLIVSVGRAENTQNTRTVLQSGQQARQ